MNKFDDNITLNNDSYFENKKQNTEFIAKNNKNFFLKCPKPTDEQWKNKVMLL